MAAKTGDAPKDVESPKTGTAKLPEDFVPNEPSLRSGKDTEGKPDGTLGPSQVERAASEALLSLSPQPTVEKIHKVFLALEGKKFGSAAEAGKAAVDALNGL